MLAALRKLHGVAWVPGLSLLLAVCLSLTPLYAQLESWLSDSQQRLSAREQYFDATLVVEIDEASLESLHGFFGNWPYPRDVYALLLDYLGDMGAGAVVFDVLFNDARDGDPAFRAAIAHTGKTVLAASALNKPSPPETLARLAERGLQSAHPLPALAWSGVALPNPGLAGSAVPPQIGMISVLNDPDGILRGIPLIHEVNGVYLPSLVLASLFPERGVLRLDYSPGHAELHVAGQSWPVDERGMVRLQFPANANPLLLMPLSKLAGAALGIPGREIDPALLRGKTVFIGNTALFSDHVNTPRGIMNGVHVLAIAHEMLRHHLVLKPPGPLWNGLLLLFALLPAAWVAARPGMPVALCVLVGAGTAVFVEVVNLALLRWMCQQSWLVFPLLVILAATLAGIAVTLREEARRRAQVALAQASAEIDLARKQQRFIAMVSHEFRTPLAIIEASLQNLKLMAADLPAGIVSRHGKIHRASHRLQALINNHLTEDRLKRANQPPKSEPFDVFELASRTARRAEWPEMICTTDELHAIVHGDMELLRIVFSNLIDNAMKYSPEGGLIYVEGNLDGATAEIRVSDNGIGITPDALPHVFEQYYRADNVKQGGAGLGLYLVKEIVERHGGTISAESRPESGTTLRVRLPVAG